MPSPVAERPGLLIRDPMRFSDSVIVVPWVLARALRCFDGQQSALDLRTELVRQTGMLDVASIAEDLISALSKSAFLEDEAFQQTRAARIDAFAASPVRQHAHGGSAYPVERAELEGVLRGYADPAGCAPVADGLTAIAAPHVSPFGGWQSYRAAYHQLSPELRDRTFIILGTSHYGEPEKFGLTRKSFETPLGRTQTELALVDRLISQGGSAVSVEDYCHAVEHSIEFQVLFLQWIFGPDVRVVPILCGPFARALNDGGTPEDDPAVARFFDVLGDAARREGDRLLWVLGVDMAHIGRRYGDQSPARAHAGYLQEVEARDRARIDRMQAGDAHGFWDLVQENCDDIRWCGSSPIYTFLRTVPKVRGAIHRYEQWNIDDESVVSFAGISFRRA